MLEQVCRLLYSKVRPSAEQLPRGWPAAALGHARCSLPKLVASLTDELIE